MNDLDKALKTAQATADRTGTAYSVLNLNTVGESLYVVRHYNEGHQAGPYAHQFVRKIEPNI